MLSRRAVAAGLGLLLLVGAACERGGAPSPADARPADAAASVEAPRFAGAAVCAGCHASEADAWRRSHHALAMQPLAEASALAGAPDASLRDGGFETRVFRRDGRRFVHAPGPDGVARDYEALYAFGVDPLRQLLLPLGRGRLQATTIAWDARPAADGGQRWFSLLGDQRVPPGDALHWSGLAQSWNGSCAECHATGLRKGYRPDEDRYETTWSELSVSCEACHGPGSRHVAWAERAARAGAAPEPERGLLVALRGDGARWRLGPGERIARRSAPRAEDAEQGACGRCHARRSVIAPEYEYGRPLLDTHRPALLDADLYTDDGQLRDEVFEWGSFLQSRMHAAGVTCSDCHDPHTGSPRAAGNALCAQCHRPEAFDVPAHHRHAPGSEASRCVSCHMPTRLYMVVDARHDHSLRVPRPDLSRALGTRDACTACHRGRDPRWAAAAVARWYGASRRREPHFGEALHAARSGAAGAEQALAALADDARQPAIARATALQELAAWLSAASLPALQRGVSDPDALVRLGAVGAAEALAPAQRLAALAPLLRDPVRAVRTAAASALSSVPPSEWAPADRAALAPALAEWRAAQEANADRPEAHVNLGSLHARFGERDAARAEYEAALRLGPWFVPAWLNLADLLREEGRDGEAEPLLRRALEIAPDSADAHHALGLLLVRRGALPQAIDSLQRAAQLAPANGAYALAYALALQAAGESDRALAFLEGVHERRPGDRQTLLGLATIARDAGRRADARRWAAELSAALPGDPGAGALRRELERADATPSEPGAAAPAGRGGGRGPGAR